VTIESGTFSVDIDLCCQPAQHSGNMLPVGFETATGGDRRLGQARAQELGRRQGARS
jgi:hypothetical protein